MKVQKAQEEIIALDSDYFQYFCFCEFLGPYMQWSWTWYLIDNTYNHKVVLLRMCYDFLGGALYDILSFTQW